MADKEFHTDNTQDHLERLTYVKRLLLARTAGDPKAEEELSHIALGMQDVNDFNQLVREAQVLKISLR